MYHLFHDSHCAGSSEVVAKVENRYPDTIRRLVDSFPKLTPELKKAARFMVETRRKSALARCARWRAKQV